MENIFNNLHVDPGNDLIDEIINNEHIKIERVITKGLKSNDKDWRTDNENKWLILLKGTAIICFSDGNEAVMNKGDYINIPVHTEHRIRWSVPYTESLWLAIYYT